MQTHEQTESERAELWTRCRDLEAEVKRLRGLLAAAYKMVPQQHAV